MCVTIYFKKYEDNNYNAIQSHNITYYLRGEREIYAAAVLERIAIYIIKYNFLAWKDNLLFFTY